MNRIEILSIYSNVEEGRVAQVATTNERGKRMLGVIGMTVLYVLAETDQIRAGQQYVIGCELPV